MRCGNVVELEIGIETGVINIPFDAILDDGFHLRGKNEFIFIKKLFIAKANGESMQVRFVFASQCCNNRGINSSTQKRTQRNVSNEPAFYGCF